MEALYRQALTIHKPIHTTSPSSNNNVCSASTFSPSDCRGPYRSNFLHRQCVQSSLKKNAFQFKGIKGRVGSKKAVSHKHLSVSCSVLVKESYGASTIKGSARAEYEDTFSIEIDSSGSKPSFYGVFDGHGGMAVAEYLKTGMWPVYKEKLATGSANPVRATEEAFAEVDQATLAAPKGLFGALRERGLGGSRCGATAATLVLLPGSKWRMLAANVGDARVVLSRGGQAVQLSVDHKPDVEEERQRIEARNPTPKKPLVQNVNGIWRVGGLLALSRAFGDVYLKNWSDGLREGASGGFGLTAEPSVMLEDITPEDELVILGTDGLWDAVPNQDAVDFCLAEKEIPLNVLAKKLMNLAVERGSTDDVTVVIVRLPQTKAA